MHGSDPTSATVHVTRQDRLDELCGRFRKGGLVAFDTEFVMEDRYETEVCLIQLADDSGVAIVDPFLDLDLSGVWGLVCDPEVETIVHAGQEDLALCVQHTGHVPRRIFDVQIVAGLVGYEFPISLQKLVRATLKTKLHKGKTLTNWRQRPLTSAQLQYAADDVRYLPGVYKFLLGRLERYGRKEWAREELARFERMSLYTQASEDKLRRVKGARALRGRSLAVLHDVLAWRDQLAERWNRPPRAVLKDHLAVEIARNEITSFSHIRELRGINLSDSSVRALCGVAKAALQRPKEEWPQAEPREEELPGEAALIALATSVIRSHCEDQDLAYSLVATKNTIRDLIRHQRVGRPRDRSQVELISGWRGRAVGHVVEDVLAGRRMIQVAAEGRSVGLRLVPADAPVERGT